MNIGPPIDAGHAMRSAYSDLNGLPAADPDDPRALEEAAKQFESLFIDIWLQGMRQANQSLASDNYLSSSQVRLHEEMLDHQWAVHMAESGGLGLAKMMVDQMTGNLSLNRHAGVVGAPVSAGTVAAQAARPGVGPAVSDSEHDGTPLGFLKTVGREVRAALDGTALPALAVVAQAALETGWGRFVPGDRHGSSNNLFGIKSRAVDEPSIEQRTREYLNGRWVTLTDQFRRYASHRDSVLDYVQLLNDSTRYTRVVGAQDPTEFADELQAAGYATDPAYAEKLKAVIDTVMQFPETAWRR